MTQFNKYFNFILSKYDKYLITLPKNIRLNDLMLLVYCDGAYSNIRNIFLSHNKIHIREIIIPCTVSDKVTCLNIVQQHELTDLIILNIEKNVTSNDKQKFYSDLRKIYYGNTTIINQATKIP